MFKIMEKTRKWETENPGSDSLFLDHLYKSEDSFRKKIMNRMKISPISSMRQKVKKNL